MKCPQNCGCDYFRGGYHVFNIKVSENLDAHLRFMEGASPDGFYGDLSEEWLDAFESSLPTEPGYPYSNRDATITRLFGA